MPLPPAAAAAAGDVAAVEQWLKAGGDPNAVHKSLKGTALQAAARGDHVECLEVSWPADVELQLPGCKPHSRSLNASHAGA